MTSSSYTYDVCQPFVSSQCVSWQGPPIPCLNICTGQSLTQTQTAIANSICTLLGDVDMSTITIPQCLVTLWGTQSPSILNLFGLLLQEACIQNTTLSSLQSQITNIDPLVTVDYQCCATNPCVTTGTVTLSVALQNIINCLCTLNSQVASFNNDIANLTSITNNLNQQLGIINNFINTQTTLNSTLSASIQALQTADDCIINGVTTATAFPINLSSC